MSRLIILAALLVAAACAPQAPAYSPQPEPPANPEASPRPRAEVLATIQGFLDGLRARDTTMMAQHMDSLTRFTLLRATPDGGTQPWVLTGR